MAIRAILLDFDGTCLQRDQTYLSIRNMTALRKAMELGVMIIPCTGRCEDMFPPQIAMDKRIRYWVTTSGTRVIDRLTGKIIHYDPYTPEESARLCRLFEGQGMFAEIAALGHIYVEKAINDELWKYNIPPHHVWYMDFGLQIAVDSPARFFLENQIGMDKVNVYNLEPARKQALTDALTETGLVDITSGMGMSLQFFPKKLDKRAVVAKLLTHIGLTYDDVMAMGDSSYDLPVIEPARIGVTFQNAPDWIQARADYVAPACFDDGCAEAIERFILRPAGVTL